MSDALFWDKQYRDNKTFWDIGAVSPPLAAYFQQLSNKNTSILIPGCGNAYEAAWLLQHGFFNLTIIDISPTLTSRLHEKFASLSFSSSPAPQPSSESSIPSPHPSSDSSASALSPAASPASPASTLSSSSATPPSSSSPLSPYPSSASSTTPPPSGSSPAPSACPPPSGSSSLSPSAFLPSSFRILTGDFFLLEEQFDLIIEQTFFCAFPPSFRPAYAEKMHQLLRPGGKLAGLLFDRDFPSNPPSGLSSTHSTGHATGESSGRSSAALPSGPPYGGHTSEYQQLFEKKFNIKTLSPCYNSIPPRAGTEIFFIAQKPG